MNKKKRRKRSLPKVSRYRRVVGRLSHSMVALAVLTLGLTLGLASVGWAANGKALLLGETNTATLPTKVTNSGSGPALQLEAASGPALAVNTTAVVPKLNADQVDGLDADTFATKSALNAEITDRQNGDAGTKNYVDNSVANEAAARTSNDSSLQSNINNEAVTRAGQIAREAATRAAADNDLDKRVTDLEQRVTALENAQQP
jgi:hypothetical protein